MTDTKKEMTLGEFLLALKDVPGPEKMADYLFAIRSHTDNMILERLDALEYRVQCMSEALDDREKETDPLGVIIKKLSAIESRLG